MNIVCLLKQKTRTEKKLVQLNNFLYLLFKKLNENLQTIGLFVETKNKNKETEREAAK